MQGTSLSSPFVLEHSGLLRHLLIAAAVLQKNPNVSEHGVPLQTHARLLDSKPSVLVQGIVGIHWPLVASQPSPVLVVHN